MGALPLLREIAILSLLTELLEVNIRNYLQGFSLLGSEAFVVATWPKLVVRLGVQQKVRSDLRSVLNFTYLEFQPIVIFEFGT